jgi:hypothetical protein
MVKGVFLGVDLSKVNWYYVFYVILSIMFVTFTVTKLYPMGIERAVIVAIGFILVLYFFAQRWFSKQSANKNTDWPPHINSCPDFFTYVPILPGTITTANPAGTPGCVDMLGTGISDGITKTSSADVQGSSALAAGKIFKIGTTPLTSANLSNFDILKQVCAQCQRDKVTWEGIYDGDKCTALNRKSLNPEASSSSCQSS